MSCFGLRNSSVCPVPPQWMQTGADCAFSTIFRAAWDMARLSPIGATIALTITHNFKLRYTVKTGLPEGLGPRAAIHRLVRDARESGARAITRLRTKLPPLVIPAKAGTQSAPRVGSQIIQWSQCSEV